MTTSPQHKSDVDVILRSVPRAVRLYFQPFSSVAKLLHSAKATWALGLVIVTILSATAVGVVAWRGDREGAVLIPAIGLVVAIGFVAVSEYVISRQVAAVKREEHARARRLAYRFLEISTYEASQMAVDLLSEGSPDSMAAKDAHRRFCHLYQANAKSRFESRPIADLVRTHEETGLMFAEGQRIGQAYQRANDLIDCVDKGHDRLREAAIVLRDAVSSSRSVLHRFA